MRASLSLTAARAAGGGTGPTELWGLLFAVALPPAGARAIAPFLATRPLLDICDRPLAMQSRPLVPIESGGGASASVGPTSDPLGASGGWCVGAATVAVPVDRAGGPPPAIAALGRRLASILSATAGELVPAAADGGLPTGAARPAEQPPDGSALARLASGALERAIDEVGGRDDVRRAEALEALHRVTRLALVQPVPMTGNGRTGVTSVVARRGGAGLETGAVDLVGSVGAGLTALLVWPTSEPQRLDLRLPLRDRDGRTIGQVEGSVEVAASAPEPGSEPGP